MAGDELTGPPHRRRRVPYEWILGAMFVGSFALFPDCAHFFPARAVWLLAVGPITGLALGVKREPMATAPRSWPMLVVATAGAIYFVAAVMAFRIAGRDFTLWLMALRWWPTPVLLTFLSLVVAARQPGGHGEPGVFANATVLLLFAFGIDAIWAPRH